jgi:nucleotide-binding universal stress UspA family protein
MQTLLSRIQTIAEPPAAAVPGQYNAANGWLDFAPGENAPGQDERPVFASKIFLVPLTLSNGSRETLQIARYLARQNRARLVLLHVVQLNIAGEERGIPRARLLDDLCRNAKIRLRELAGCGSGPAAEEILVREGRPADAIVEMATRLRADTILMRRRGHRGWLKWLHPNTALNVARQAPCRVLLLSPENRAGSVHSTIAERGTQFPLFVLDCIYFCLKLKPPIKANYAQAGTLQKERTPLARHFFGGQEMRGGAAVSRSATAHWRP